MWPATADEQIQYVKELRERTTASLQERGSKMRRAYEKKFGTRIYSAEEHVLVDVGRRTKVKQTRHALEAKILTQLSGGDYQLEIIEGDRCGEQFTVEIDRIEPLEGTISSQQMSSQAKSMKKQSLTSVKQPPTVTKTPVYGLRPIVGKNIISKKRPTLPKRVAAIDNVYPGGLKESGFAFCEPTNETKHSLSCEIRITESREWKLACAGQLFSNDSLQPLTRQSARRKAVIERN